MICTKWKRIAFGLCSSLNQIQNHNQNHTTNSVYFGFGLVFDPDLCRVGDEVGGNISMKWDGHAGRLYPAPKQRVVYQKFCKADRKFTLIGLSSLDGQSMICIVIIQGSQVNCSSDVGIDVSI